MTGLMAIFWRHLAVLTNFTRNEVESRLIGQERAFARGAPGSAPQGQDRAPKGWVRTYGDGPADHPLHPLQGFRGPLRCQQDLAVYVLGGWVVPV